MLQLNKTYTVKERIIREKCCDERAVKHDSVWGGVILEVISFLANDDFACNGLDVTLDLVTARLELMMDIRMRPRMDQTHTREISSEVGAVTPS
jgi:hypothetical protein